MREIKNIFKLVGWWIGILRFRGRSYSRSECIGSISIKIINLLRGRVEMGIGKIRDVDFFLVF